MIVLELEGRCGADVGVRLLDLLAVERRAPALEDGEQALSAGIDHARLLEGGEHVRRLGQNGLAAADDLVKQPRQVVRVLADIARGILGDDADDRQDRALLGLHDGLVGGIRAGAQRLGKLLRVHGLAALDAAGKAAQDLREDDAGVAARALECAARRQIRHAGRAVHVLSGDFLDGGFHRQGHVGARIAVRHGEHVQRVDGFTVLFKQIGSRDDHLFEEQSVDSLL